MLRALPSRLLTPALLAVGVAAALSLAPALAAVAGPAPASHDLAMAAADRPFSIGNRVFLDNGANGGGAFAFSQRNDGVQGLGEVGVNGVRVELYRDANLDAVFAPSELVRFDVTAQGGAGAGRPGADAAGYYLFDFLDYGSYQVVIPASQFAAGGPLAGYHSSEFDGTETVGAAGAVGTPAVDLDDNGVEPASRRPDLDGIRSGTIVLDDVGAGNAGTETLAEQDLSFEPDPGPLAIESSQDYNGGLNGPGPTGWDGPGSIGRWNTGTMTDDASTVAVDFGLTPPMSLGNRVWSDDSADPTQWSPGGSRNNGTIDATDDGAVAVAGLQNPGVSGVTLQLYYDENDNSIVDGGDTLVTTTVSGSNGFYLFDGLAAGNYLVRVPSTQFATGEALNQLISAYDAVAQVDPTNQTDSNDNGIDNAAPATSGITSRQIQLLGLFEPTGETDLAAQPYGTHGEADIDSDLTIDFGFVRPPLSLGNQVFSDDHPTSQAARNNGIRDAGEAAIPSVEVALYRDLDADGVVDAGEDTGFRDTTDANGFYLFSNLPAGGYLVAVTSDNFVGGAPFENLISSQSVAPNPIAADNQVDGNDNGRDAQATGVGIVSSRIVLSYGGEPTAETAVNSPTDGPNGRGSLGERDSDSDLSVDFGFFTPMSLGNRVWIDDTDVASRWATSRNDGTLDSTADDLDNPNLAGVQGQGVAGVTLRLYRDLDTDGVIDAGEDTGRTTTTNATGYYLFDGVPRGSYLVGVEATNFTPGAVLEGFASSFTASAPTDNQVDSRDDGVGTTPSGTNGVVSPRITLSYTSTIVGAEPTNESDPTPQLQVNRGTNGERNDFSDLSIDFGFARAATSVGNVVWDDDNATAALRGNAVRDAGEPGLAGIEVALYRDLNGDQLLQSGEDTGLRDTTAADGYYLFGNLPSAGYFVVVTDGNFAAGAPLEGRISSASTAPNPTPADDQVDGDDNGLDVAESGIGIRSLRIALAPGTEPTAETPVNSPGDGPAGRGVNGEADTDSDLAVDFGFVTSTSDLAVTADYVSIDTALSQITWGVGVANNGPDADTVSTVVTLTLPAGQSFVSASGAGFTCSAAGVTVTCTRAGGLPLGSAGSITLVTGYTGNPSGQSLVASIAGGNDPVAPNDADTAVVPAGVIPVVVPPVVTIPLVTGPIAFTGSDVAGMLGLALALLVAGVAVVLGRRRFRS